MKKLLTTTFILSLLIFGSQNAFSKNMNNQQGDFPPPPPHQGQFGGPQMGQKPPMVDLDEVLGLTDKQKAQAKANRIKARKEIKPVIDEIRNKHEAIMDVIDSDLPKDQQKAKIQALQNDINVLEKKANTLREQNMQDFEKILTAKQKAKFAQLKKEHRPQPQKSRPMPPPPFD